MAGLPARAGLQGMPPRGYRELYESAPPRTTLAVQPRGLLLRRALTDDPHGRRPGVRHHPRRAAVAALAGPEARRRLQEAEDPWRLISNFFHRRRPLKPSPAGKALRSLTRVWSASTSTSGSSTS